MSENVPSELRYAETHEWVREEENGICVIGITDHAQHLLGDLVYVELPEAENNIRSGDEAGVVESVKAASDVYSPLSGEVIAVNEALADTPELVNQDPYGDGWLFKIKFINHAELEELLDSESYNEKVAAEEA